MHRLFYLQFDGLPKSGQLMHDQIRQHHHQRMSSGSRLQLHKDWTHLQQAGLAGAERPLDLSKIFVPGIDHFFANPFRRQVRLQDITTVQFTCLRHRVRIHGQKQFSVFFFKSNEWSYLQALRPLMNRAQGNRRLRFRMRLQVLVLFDNVRLDGRKFGSS
jgi:hypothetical protein